MKGLLIVLLSLLTIRAAGQAQRHEWAPADIEKEYKGKPYPPFDIVRVGGGHLTNAACKGKVVLLDFWFEGCLGCREEFAALNELHDSLHNDTACVFMAVTFDEPDSLPGFLRRYGISYPVATTSQEQIHSMLCRGYPSKVVLDKNGNVVRAGLASMGATDKQAVLSSYTVQGMLKMVRELEAE
jgi:cytochrome oxidase Cu insertion factor (SCO1/SenC/PrrC family)